MVIMNRPFKEDRQIEDDLIQCSENLRNAKTYDAQNVNSENIQENIPIDEMVSLLNTTVEEIQMLKRHISNLYDQVNSLHNKNNQQQTESLKEQSRKNAMELRRLVGLSLEIDLLCPKTNISGLISEYAGEDVDSLEVLKSAREDDDE